MQRKNPRRQRAQVLRDLKAEATRKHQPTTLQFIHGVVDRVMADKRNALKDAK